MSWPSLPAPTHTGFSIEIARIRDCQRSRNRGSPAGNGARRGALAFSPCWAANYIQEAAVDCHFPAVVVDKPERPEFIHEKINS